LAAVGGWVATLVLVLHLAMRAWVAALIVTLVYAAGAAVLALRGRERLAEAAPPTPEQTIESVKEDVQWAKTQLPSAKK